jgi:charged multivesicular body protein 6
MSVSFRSLPTSFELADGMLTSLYSQEISDMLGGKISNQDEEEVEDELAALEAEFVGETRKLPTVPETQLPIHAVEANQEHVRIKQTERTPMLVS